jgi:hypothetical protein
MRRAPLGTLLRLMVEYMFLLEEAQLFWAKPPPPTLEIPSYITAKVQGIPTIVGQILQNMQVCHFV